MVAGLVVAFLRKTGRVGGKRRGGGSESGRKRVKAFRDIPENVTDLGSWPERVKKKERRGIKERLEALYRGYLVARWDIGPGRGGGDKETERIDRATHRE